MFSPPLDIHVSRTSLVTLALVLSFLWHTPSCVPVDVSAHPSFYVYFTRLLHECVLLTSRCMERPVPTLATARTTGQSVVSIHKRLKNRYSGRKRSRKCCATAFSGAPAFNGAPAFSGAAAFSGRRAPAIAHGRSTPQAGCLLYDVLAAQPRLKGCLEATRNSRIN